MPGPRFPLNIDSPVLRPRHVGAGALVPSPRPPAPVIEAIKGRRLIQIVGSVAAGCWAILEVVDQLSSRGVLPEILYYVTLIWCAVGLVAAAVVGWFHGERGRQAMPRSEAIVLGALAVIGLGATGVTLARGNGPDVSTTTAAVENSLDPTRILVEYFRDESPDGSLAYLANGLTESLIYELSAIPTLDVLSENTSDAFRSVGIDSIAQRLQSGTVVTGSLRPEGEGVRVEVALWNGQSGEETVRRPFEHPSLDPVELRESLSNQVGLFLREALGRQVELRPAEGESSSSEAWEAVLKAAEAARELEEAATHGDGAAVMAAWALSDSLNSVAQELDPEWARPPAERAHLAMRIAQLSEGEIAEAASWVTRGLEHANDALTLNPEWPAALETRGALRYLRWRLGMEPDPVAAPVLLQAAEDDLEQAVRLDGTRAVAYNVLSIIHSQKPDLAAAKVAARRAYEEDAYVRAADRLLFRLYATSYDLQQFTDAQYYCDEGQRRFPGHYRFVECELWLRTTRQMEPDVDRAWELVEQYAEAAPFSPEFFRSRGEIIAAGVIARAGDPDSANAVMNRVRVDADVDPARELLGLQAVFRLQWGEPEAAVDLLTTYLTASPEHREGWQWSSHWWWQDLRENPDFRSLIGS